MPNSWVNRLLLLILLLASSVTMVVAQRAIPDDNLAYPVLLTLGNESSGSGFYLRAKDVVYLVTAKHVLFNPATQQLLSSRLELLSYSKDPNESTRNLVSVDMQALQANGNIKSHPSEDVAVLKLFNMGIVDGKPAVIPMQGVVVRAYAKDGILGADLETIATFSQVLTGNEVIVFGYPSSLALQQLRQLDPNRPLLRKGIVAGTIPEKRSIILDCPVYFGNSGGPVLELDPQGLGKKLKIIGVVNQYVPFLQVGGSQTFAMQIASNSGYSIATPMDFVLELIN